MNENRNNEMVPEKKNLNYKYSYVFVRCLSAELVTKGQGSSKKPVALKMLVSFRTSDEVNWFAKAPAYEQTIVMFDLETKEQNEYAMDWLYRQQCNTNMSLNPLDAIENLVKKNIYIPKSLLG